MQPQNFLYNYLVCFNYNLYTTLVKLLKKINRFPSYK